MKRLWNLAPSTIELACEHHVSRRTAPHHQTDDVGISGDNLRSFAVRLEITAHRAPVVDLLDAIAPPCRRDRNDEQRQSQDRDDKPLNADHRGTGISGS